MPQPFYPADILLPRLTAPEDWQKWSVIACDQFTSEPEYWEAAAALVGSAPSTLNLILPESKLGREDTPAAIEKINQTMREYDQSLFTTDPQSLIYVERFLNTGVLRQGLIGCVDLREYSYEAQSNAQIRATEGTVLERIPPRVAIRRDAVLELPHVMLLMDDPERGILEPLAAQKNTFQKLYDFDLMLDGGHIAGYLVSPAEQARILAALETLATPEAMQKKYGLSTSPMPYAMGDGNHSLASAKAAYEEVCRGLTPEEAAVHPARYALCELVNLHSDALEFEPIYRTVFGLEPARLLADFSAYAAAQQGPHPAQTVTLTFGNEEAVVTVAHPTHSLAVGTVQNFLDAYLPRHPEARLDYIHGLDTARELSCRENTVSLLFAGVKKEDLFPSVLQDGSLPRKTFSMGEARDKRYYLEARHIR